MSNNITSGSNLIVSNDATIGKNLFVSGTSSLGTISSANATITNLSANNANLNNVIANNVVVGGIDIFDYIDNNTNNNNSNNSNSNNNISYDSSLNKTTITGNTHINNLTAGSIDANTIKLNGANVVDSITNSYTSYIDTKISNLIGGAPASLDTLKEITDLLSTDSSLSQTLVSSISGINSSITSLQNNVTQLQTNDTVQANVNTSTNNSITNINTTLSGVDSKLFTINSNIALLQSDNTINTNSITTLNSSVTDLSSKVSTNTNNISSLQSSNTTNTNNINTINTSITDLNSKVGTLTSTSSTNTNNIATLTNSLNTLDAKVTANQTSVQSTVTALNSEVDSLQASMNQALTNFSYSNGKTRITDLAVNDASITTLRATTSTADTLLIGSTNVMTALNGISQTLTGIVYDSGADITYINNHVVLPNSNTLYLGDTTFNTKSEILKRSLLTGDNAFSGNNTFASDTTPLKITTKNNPSLNNGLSMHFIGGNGTYNDLSKTDDIMLMTGNIIKDNPKSGIVIAPWATGKKGIRVSLDKLEVAPGIIETLGTVIDASTSKVTIKPQGYNGGLEVYTSNGIDASLKTLRLSITDGGFITSGYTSLNNGNLVLLDSNTFSYKNIIMKNKVLLLANASDRAVQLYQNNETFSIDSSYMNSSRISMSVRGAGTYDTNNNPTGTVVNALTIDSSNTAINNNTAISGTLSTTSNTTLCSGVLDITPTELTLNKTVHYVGASALFYDTTTKTGSSVTNIYRNSDKNLYIDSDYFKNSSGGGVIFRLRDKYEALGGTASNVLNLQPDSITMNKNLTLNGSINGISSTTLSYLDATSSIQTQINTINSKVGIINYTPTVTISKTQSNSSFYGLVATLTTTGSFKRSVKFVSPISIYRKASANRPPDNSISSLQIKTIINSISCEVKKNGVVQPAGTIGFTFSETLPKNLYAYKWATQTNATNNEYEYEMYAGNLTILHNIDSSSASEIYTYHINVSATIVASNETVIMQYLNTNTNINTSYNTYPNVLSAVDSYYIPKYYASPSYEFSVSRSNLPTTGLIQTNEIGVNEIGADKLHATTANMHTIYNTGNLISSGYIKSRSNIAGYMFNGNLTTSSISPFSIYPIICSLKGITPLNADDYYLVNPGYRLLLFDDLNYNGYDPKNDANNSLSNFTNFYQELINDSNEPKTFALTNVNKTESIIVYYRDNDTLPWTLIYMPYLSYVP